MNRYLRSSRPPLGLAITLAVLGLVFLFGGSQLAMSGGSWYYVLTGIGFFVVTILVLQRKSTAILAYAALLGYTIVWAIFESGFEVWALMPRITAPAIFGVWFTLPWVRQKLNAGRKENTVILTLVATSVVVLWGSYLSNKFIPSNNVKPLVSQHAASEDSSNSWTHYGGDERGQRFVTSTQIDKHNVGNLELAWSYRVSSGMHGDVQMDSISSAESTPIEISGRLFFCTSNNVAISLDAETGEELWRYNPRVSLDPATHRVCRGVAHHLGDELSAQCNSRLLMGTLDNRLISINAEDGHLCSDFGEGGFINLNEGLGEVLPGYVYVTSPPTVINGVVVVGSFVFDNQSTDEPAGVVRGYDAVSGQLLWAWDVQSPQALAPLQPGEQYPRNSPNVWSVASADAELGLVFLPTGNTPPDFFGGQRTEAQDRYPSSVVALDVQTGNVRWSFQTVNHDIWDFDIAAQPVLIEWPTERGTRPGLIVPTKRGEVFVVDRETGEPLTPVVQRPVPQNPEVGEWLADTQPFSVGLPSFAPADLDETSMWGATPIDQMWCRLRFLKSRYEGQFTPQSTQGTISFPGAFGIINWGSVSVDPDRLLMVVNTSYLPWYQKLIARSDADKLGIAPWGSPSERPAGGHSGREIFYAQAGTPYAIDSRPFLSPLGLPCHEPPWGELSVVDLGEGKIIWRRPLGHTGEVAPFGVPLPMGVFNIGGSLTTRSGLTFIAATIDDYFRAFDVDTGQELWKTKLPAGGQSNPISYVSREGRQYVVIAAGGHVPMKTKTGDYLLAYALPVEQPEAGNSE